MAGADGDVQLWDIKWGAGNVAGWSNTTPRKTPWRNWHMSTQGDMFKNSQSSGICKNLKLTGYGG